LGEVRRRIILPHLIQVQSDASSIDSKRGREMGETIDRYSSGSAGRRLTMMVSTSGATRCSATAKSAAGPVNTSLSPATTPDRRPSIAVSTPRTPSTEPARRREAACQIERRRRHRGLDRAAVAYFPAESDQRFLLGAAHIVPQVGLGDDRGRRRRSVELNREG